MWTDALGNPQSAGASKRLLVPWYERWEHCSIQYSSFTISVCCIVWRKDLFAFTSHPAYFISFNGKSKITLTPELRNRAPNQGGTAGSGAKQFQGQTRSKCRRITPMLSQYTCPATNNWKRASHVEVLFRPHHASTRQWSLVSLVRTQHCRSDTLLNAQRRCIFQSSWFCLRKLALHFHLRASFVHVTEENAQTLPSSGRKRRSICRKQEIQWKTPRKPTKMKAKCERVLQMKGKCMKLSLSLT